jgi:GT2 family glycosyltransferase
MSDLAISVIIPVYQRAAELNNCLIALGAQSLPLDRFEVIVVDQDLDRAPSALTQPLHLKRLYQSDRGAAGARNVGLAAAEGDWIAFTDSDCIPSRTWLHYLLESADRSEVKPLGVAGRTLGYRSESPAAHYVDLTGGLDAEKYLAHPKFPWAPTNNMMVRRDALQAVNGFDARFSTYEGGDLSYRLRKIFPGEIMYAPRAIVLHHHRSSWRAYWQQQVQYGRGYAQFFLCHQSDVKWPIGYEARAWLRIVGYALTAIWPDRSDRGLVRRGNFIKNLAQHLGFAAAYYNRSERARWSING